MQMFVLDLSPNAAAKALADVHVRVICREVTMCLSSWYAKHIAHNLDELPYKAFNHPIVEEMSNRDTRIWATHYASAVFDEFAMRFHKVHASRCKFRQLLFYMDYYDQINVLRDQPDMEKARFSFVEKDKGVITDLTVDEAVKRYRAYYRHRLATMKVKVSYTNTQPPDWLGETYNETLQGGQGLLGRPQAPGQ